MSMLYDALVKQYAANRETEKSMGLEKKRMYATERENFLRMHIANDILEGLNKDIAPRLALAGVSTMMAQASENVREAMQRVYFTVPPDQRRTIQRNADQATYAIGVKTPGAIGRRSGDKNWGMFVSYSDIGIMAEAAKDHCLTCMGSAQEQEACKLRKAFDRIGVDVEHKDGECGYREMI